MNTKRAINQYDLDGNYIRTFDSAYKACCERKEQYAYGFIWRYE